MPYSATRELSICAINLTTSYHWTNLNWIHPCTARHGILSDGCNFPDLPLG